MVSDFDKKRNRKFLFQALGIVFLLGVFSLVVADVKIYQKKQVLTAQINYLQKQIQDLKKSNQILENEISNADNPDYLEKLAYEQFGQARPGETQYMFVKPQEKPEATVNSPATKLWSVWFSGVWSWLKSKF
jgi:cell division protein FtsB